MNHGYEQQMHQIYIRILKATDEFVIKLALHYENACSGL